MMIPLGCAPLWGDEIIMPCRALPVKAVEQVFFMIFYDP
jgi:hypothetical protein